MADNTDYTLEYDIPAKPLKAIIKCEHIWDILKSMNYDFEDIDNYKDDDLYQITFHENDYFYYSDFEDILIPLEIPFDLHYESNDNSYDGDRYVRHEKDVMSKIPITEIKNVPDEDYMKVDAQELRKALKEQGPGAVDKILLNKIKEHTPETELEKANIPSEERLFFLAAKSNDVDLIEIVKTFYKNGVNMNYKDLESGKSTFEMLDDKNSELSSEIKKDLLKRNTKKRDELVEDTFSL